MPIRVALVEDNAGLRESLTVLIDGSDGFTCIGAFGNAEEALRRLPARKPDVVLMDVHLPKGGGIDCTRELKGLLPTTQVMMLTVEEDSRVAFAALEAGASGYLLKRLPPAKLLEAIQELHRGGSPMSSQIARRVVQTFHERGRSQREEENLTPRERELLDLLAQGYRSREAADQLSLSVQTVNSHCRRIYEKLQVRSRAAAVAKHLRR